MQILDSKTAMLLYKQTVQNSALRKSVLKEWKICVQNIENFPKAMENWLVRDFLRQIGQFHAVACQNYMVAESWRD